ncbi:MAG: pyocin knob domain-containing protein, partial [Moraxellaceae bacterium]
MLEPITKQELIDASADALALEQVVNGTDTLDVTSRLARTYPTLAKALRLIVENGLLGATPFNLGSQMIASSLVDGDYAVVTDDPNPEINGFYQRQSGLWEYLAWNPLNQAKAYADANPMFRPSVLAAAADFNTLTVEGRTVVPTNEIAEACTNRPSSNAGVLDVALIGSGVFQTYRVFEFDLAYERQRLSGGTWTDWVQSASKDMVDTSAANTLQSAQDYADVAAVKPYDIVTASKNLFATSNIVSNSALNSTNGGIVAFSGWTRSGMIPVVAGQTYTLSGTRSRVGLAWFA